VAYWAEARAVVDIPTWSFKRAVVHVPREALGARAPPGARGGVLRIHLNGTVVELVEAPPEAVATYSYLKPDDKITAPKVRSEWVKPPARRGPLDREKQEDFMGVGYYVFLLLQIAYYACRLPLVYAAAGGVVFCCSSSLRRRPGLRCWRWLGFSPLWPSLCSSGCGAAFFTTAGLWRSCGFSCGTWWAASCPRPRA